ncbi:pre-rRNA-processing protein TSR1 [Nematocida sp. AWRm80]|nr:pre-rRNA-processing protein TSR1 [Nematocida sp. AWRm80]
MAAKTNSLIKGQSQKERGAKKIVSTVMITSIGGQVNAVDALHAITSKFRKAEVEEKGRIAQKRYLGQRITTRKGTFCFLTNQQNTLPTMRLKISSADRNIIVFDTQIDPAAVEIVKQTRQSNLMFLSMVANVSTGLKKEIKQLFGKQKIYTLREITRVLESKQTLNRKRQTRPVMVVDSLEPVSEREIKITGTLDKGFVSKRVLVNGMYPARIKSISTTETEVPMTKLSTLRKEDLYSTTQINKAEENLMEMMSTVKINETTEYFNDQEEYSDDQLGQINNQSEDTENLQNSEEDSEEDSTEEASLEEDTEEDSSNIEGLEDQIGTLLSDEEISEYEALRPADATDENKESPSNRYHGFKGFRSINLGMHRSVKDNEEIRRFRTQNLPDYYKDLNFISSERIRRQILAKKSSVPTNTPLEIVLELETDINSFVSQLDDDFFCVTGLFDYEGLPTITVLSFQSSVPVSIQAQSEITFDFGFAFTCPKNIVIGNGTEIIKARKESTSGTICFISPLILTDDKIQLISRNTIIGTGTHVIRKDPVIIKTVTFKGMPIKIHKRSCIVGRMFRNRADVQYFRNIKLYSSDKKEGRIKKPLGEHGLMKCYFCPPVKHSEKVYMELARRVFINPN